ncbi:MAG: MFS transporter [Bacteroidales bacterium]|nr:MFS transporter [Bacteroidales bacterium]
MYNKKVVFRSACLGMLLFGIVLITLGSVAPDLKLKLELSEISSGTLFSILPFGILIGSLLFGPVADKYGYRILLAISCVLLFAGFEGIAYSRSTGVIRIFIFIVGFGGGAVNGATNALVSDISEKDKGANLSLLGVFFGIGALGMPLILGILKDVVSFEIIVALVGALALFVGILYLIISFPLPKQARGLPFSKGIALVKDKVLLLLSFFLFFQSSFEAIINNWTTSYLLDQLAVPQNKALYTLSAFVAGMAGMRLISGTFFRTVPVRRILAFSFLLILISLVLIKTSNSYLLATTGFVILGAGLAGGFPIMLGFAGERFPELSGTAFSIALFIALLGNMLINYLMGVISQNFGIKHLITVAFAESIIMILLFLVIMKILRDQRS